ncbi:formylglycine-generating enzyme family protein [Gemmatimonadota bacterium]
MAVKIITFFLISAYFIVSASCLKSPTGSDDTSSIVVSDFQAEVGDREVELNWINPRYPGYKGTLIKRNSKKYVDIEPTYGTEIYRGTGTTVVDTGLTNFTTYYYSAFTFDEGDNFYFPMTVQVQPLPEGTELIRFIHSEYGWIEIMMASIPAGSFQMGSNTGREDERPVHTVSLDAFMMSNTEITQLQYKSVMGKNPSTQAENDNSPVEFAHWQEAVTFCNRLSEKAGLEPCYNLDTWECDFSRNGIRLPTEAEWEYACRAGTGTEYFSGNSESDLSLVGWYAGNCRWLQEVRGKDPNSWGLFDMHGNVSEFCNDIYGAYSSKSEHNPTGPVSNSHDRVVRGGSWYEESADSCRSAGRSCLDWYDRRQYIGFRIVCR